MKNNQSVKRVATDHIEKGILKYGGIIDAQLASIIKAAGLQYTPYIFNDGRVLLVLPNDLGGFLYNSSEAMFDALSLSD